MPVKKFEIQTIPRDLLRDISVYFLPYKTMIALASTNKFFSQEYRKIKKLPGLKRHLLKKCPQQLVMEIENYYYSSLCIDISGSIMAIGGGRWNEGIIQVVDINLSKVLYTIKAHDWEVTSLKIDGTFIVSGSQDRTVKIWNISTKECLRTFRGHTDVITNVGVDGNIVVSGGMDSVINVWNRETGTLMHKFFTLIPQTLDTKCCVAIKGSMIAYPVHNNSIKVWDEKKESLLHTLNGHSWPVKSIEMYETLIVSGGQDKTIKVWNGLDGVILHTLKGHLGTITCINVSSTTIISGNHLNGHIKVWDLKTGKYKYTLKGNPIDFTSCLAMDGTTIASGNGNKINIWKPWLD